MFSRVARLMFCQRLWQRLDLPENVEPDFQTVLKLRNFVSTDRKTKAKSLLDEWCKKFN